MSYRVVEKLCINDKNKMKWDDTLKGNPDKHILLKNFIAEFFPKSNYKAMYKYNEFFNFYCTIERIFNQKTHIRIDPEELAKCLDDAGYHCYITDKEFRHIKSMPRRQSTYIASRDDFFNYSDDFLLFVNVSSKDVRYLKRAMRSISLQKRPTEIVRLRFLKRKINNFFSNGIFE